MKVVGLVTEYNPFHLGHKYHLDKSKELTGATHSIAVMSSSFVQRGEPALVDKWTRAKMAIDNGVDLVIELPCLFSVQSAELFAYGGISILNSLNAVDYLAFGSENGFIEPLSKAAIILNDEPLIYKNKLREQLNLGMSYSASRSIALEYYIKEVNPNDSFSYSELIKQSNNILGIEYLKAIYKLKSSIIPVTLKRQGNNYKDLEITANIASATGIRNSLINYDFEQIKNQLPKISYDYLSDFYSDNNSFNFLDNYNQIFQYLFRTARANEMKDIMDMENGLENRILEMGLKLNNINDIVESITTKRYPSTRIKRILIHMLLDIKKETIKKVYSSPVEYIRILGSNKKGMEILNKINEKSQVSIITKFSNYKKFKNEYINIMLELEEKATDLYFLGVNQKPYKKMDYIISPYIK